MNAKIYYKFEIAFWDLVIYALSESKWVRTLIRVAYRLLPGRLFRSIVRTAFIAAMVGFLSGLILYAVAFKLI